MLSVWSVSSTAITLVCTLVAICSFNPFNNWWENGVLSATKTNTFRSAFTASKILASKAVAILGAFFWIKCCCFAL